MDKFSLLIILDALDILNHVYIVSLDENKTPFITFSNMIAWNKMDIFTPRVQSQLISGLTYLQAYLFTWLFFNNV